MEQMTFEELAKNVLIGSESLIDSLKRNIKNQINLDISTVNGFRIISNKMFPFKADDGTNILGIMYGEDGKQIYLVDSKVK